MAHSITPDDMDDPDEKTRRHRLAEAHGRISDALGALDLSEDGDEYRRLQRELFRLYAALRALDPEFQAWGGRHRVGVPHARRPLDPPTADDKHGEVEAPTRHDDFRILDGTRVLDPINPTTVHGLTVDHVITPDGEVSVEINGVPLDDLGDRPGSYVR